MTYQLLILSKAGGTPASSIAVFETKPEADKAFNLVKAYDDKLEAQNTFGRLRMVKLYE